jgi:hypothetical protein
MDLLYKYVSAERALTCLPEIGDGTLRATQPSALNDPFESVTAAIGIHEIRKCGNEKAPRLSYCNQRCFRCR